MCMSIHIFANQFCLAFGIQCLVNKQQLYLFRRGCNRLNGLNDAERKLSLYFHCQASKGYSKTNITRLH